MPAGDTLHLKMLIPATAAGAIIGKGGETIMMIQKESGANIKMSKANDYYPGELTRAVLRLVWPFDVYCTKTHT